MDTAVPADNKYLMVDMSGVGQKPVGAAGRVGVQDELARQETKDVPKVVLVLKVGRHGEKDKTGDSPLSEGGERQAFSYGYGLDHTTPTDEVYGVKVYSSGIERAHFTGQMISEGASQAIEDSPSPHLTRFDSSGNPLVHRNRDELSYEGLVHLCDGALTNLQGPFMREHHPGYAQYDERQRKAAMQDAEDYVCNLALQQYPGFVDTAASNVARLLLRQLGMADSLKDGSRAIMVDVSHNSPLISFLSKCLVRRNTDTGETTMGFSRVEEIGGSLKPAEFFEIKKTIGHDGNARLEFRFDDPHRLSGYQCSLDVDEMGRLALRATR
ncbi:MAG: histidine phosphatase family protein [Candidatus Altiarchaeota archaeon]